MSTQVWNLRIDVSVINHDGNLIDCASIATLAALSHFHRPDVTSTGEEIIIHPASEKDFLPLTLFHYPVCISFITFERFVGHSFIYIYIFISICCGFLTSNVKHLQWQHHNRSYLYGGKSRCCSTHARRKFLQRALQFTLRLLNEDHDDRGCDISRFQRRGELRGETGTANKRGGI